MKEQKVIRIDWRSLESIKKAEKLKTLYENKGLTLVERKGGFNKSIYIYQ